MAKDKLKHDFPDVAYVYRKVAGGRLFIEENTHEAYEATGDGQPIAVYERKQVGSLHLSLVPREQPNDA